MKKINHYLLPLLFFPFLFFGCSTYRQKTVSLDEKIGQMILIGFEGKAVNQNDKIAYYLLNQHIGGVILLEKNIENPKQLKKLVKSLKYYAKQGAEINNREYLPLFIAIDQEGGKVHRLKKKYGFTGINISAEKFGKLSYSSAKIYADILAKTLKENLINLNLAPVVNLNVNPNNPIIGRLGRSFSKDPNDVIKYAKIITDSLHNAGVLCSYKHFPGHGSSSTDTHKGLVDVTNTWKKDELKPYRQLLKMENSCKFIMVAHIVNKQLDPKGYPATLSKKMLKQTLRKQLGFKGIIISDDMQMKAISNNYSFERAIFLAINAGVNMFIFSDETIYGPDLPGRFIKTVKKLIKEGEISIKDIEGSYNQIVRVKNYLVFNM